MRTWALVTTVSAVVAIVVAGCSHTSTHRANSTTTASASTPTQPHIVAAVHPANARHVVGKIALHDLLKARARHLEDEQRRERILPFEYLLPPWLRPGLVPGSDAITADL